MTVRTVCKVQWENMPVTRHGRETSEYFIQRVFLETLQGKPLVIFTPKAFSEPTSAAIIEVFKSLF